MTEISVLGPIDPSSLDGTQHEAGETEKSAPWIVRKLVGSMTGRIVMSSYESLRATGTSVVCLSPWGDSSPLLLPCIRFRDLVVHTVIAATGGIAAVASPIMGPVSDALVSSFGDTILVEITLHTGFELAAKVADDLVLRKPIGRLMNKGNRTMARVALIRSERLETTGVKKMLITLKYRHVMEDAALGFYRSSLHEDSSLFATVKDYLAVEKGWFSPYLFASGRRPVIPRSMKPDILFCHGPFLSGDYKIGETLLAESANVITLCSAPSTIPTPALAVHTLRPALSNLFSRSRTPSPPPTLTPLPSPPTPRRLVVLVVGLKPHRKLWTTSARPGESVINYVLMNGCVTVVLPARVGAPVLAWDGMTLKQMWEVGLPAEGKGGGGERFDGIVNVLYEFLDLCVDWERVARPGAGGPSVAKDSGGEGDRSEGDRRTAVRDSMELLVAGAIRSGGSKTVRAEIDEERSGIAMWRIP